MGLFRMFSTNRVKGTKNYVKTQKVYEVLRTVLLFGISLSLVIAGYIQTGTRINLLTVVGVLGCLPACQSAVKTILFLRFKSTPEEIVEQTEEKRGDVRTLYDCVFTTYHKCFSISCLSVRNNIVCGYTDDQNTNLEDFYKHIGAVFRLDGIGNVTVKIFTDLEKYFARLEQMKEIPFDRTKTIHATASMRNVML